MNSIQERYNQLLIELTNFCEDNDIKYRLHGQTAKMAYLSHKYMSNSIDTKIEMCVEEVKKLIYCMKMHPIPNRVLEYMGNQKNYPGFSLKFFDPDTLYLPLNEYGNYKAYAINVEVIILRKYPENPWKRKFLLGLEVGWELNKNHPPKNLKKKHYICKWAIKALQLLLGKKILSGILFKLMIHQYNSKAGDKIFFRERFQSIILLQKDSCNSTKKIIFEECQYPIAADPEKYLSHLYKKNWCNRKLLGEKPGAELIIDERINFQDFNKMLLKNNFNLNSYAKQYKRIKKGISLRAQYYKEKNDLWNCAVKIGQVMEEEKFYLENHEYTQNLIQNFAYNTLVYHLEKYKKILADKDGITYSDYLNKELLPIYNMILQIQGKSIIHTKKQRSEGKW